MHITSVYFHAQMQCLKLTELFEMVVLLLDVSLKKYWSYNNSAVIFFPVIFVKQ